MAPPIELFHPVFARFRAKLADTEVVPEAIVRDTVSLMRSMSAIRASEQPQGRTMLSEILKQPFLRAVDLDSSTSTDHIALCGETTVDEMAAVVILEEEDELGAGGSEPSVRGSFSYMKFWADGTRRKIREGSCCPSFIVGLAGPWLVIAGAVFTSQIIVQRLTDYVWLGNSRVNDDDHILRVARILYSLQGSIEELRKYYEDLKPQPLEANKPHPRFFPSVTPYRSNNEDIGFTYISPLDLDEMCVTFLATLDVEQGERKVVVKFVERYGEEAHRLLAGLGLAPEILYVGPIGGSYSKLRMVVMEHVQGRTLVAEYRDGPIPEDVKKAVKEGLDALHNEDLVYGDLRRQNIMICKGLKFIDFDWAGKVGEVRYPLHLASCISEYDLILKEHDMKMFDDL
ncbi:uncharacterized protein EV420DRAFT_1622434 [Desarmillaria tabescens]|uniref:Uncharacterized protein n=1 Tax=Armillaria tabescens TaxID=1929756 RepID=A0AA39MVA3_ARMTA|nr:uncharacterized protein EV420DRAFT_1622434 [Desarmillaria tabescens]KAK0447483.1 hypothetical protein EV420DRAFT_1622434 [Desarmillaria tabescens]